jgi:predicted metal-dependent phosphoesterase TrpH
MQQSPDLHTHSTASDGTLSPMELVARAAAAGVTALALTDHDTVAGVAEATAAAAEHGIRLIPGVEVSVTWGGRTVHIVGLAVDPMCADMLEGLAELQDYRGWRAQEIGRRLEKAGFADAYEGARAEAAGSLIGRTHFARFLVQRGAADDLRGVFKRFLCPGSRGMCRGSGRRSSARSAGFARPAALPPLPIPAAMTSRAPRCAGCSGSSASAAASGSEVVSGSHSRDDYFVFARHATENSLFASAGSDYHGPEKPWIELGKLPALPDGCTPIWSLPALRRGEPRAAPEPRRGSTLARAAASPTSAARPARCSDPRQPRIAPEMADYIEIHPGQPAAAAHRSCGGCRCARRRGRLPDRLLLRARLPHRREVRAGPHPHDPPRRRQAQLHAGLPRSVRDRHLRAHRQQRLSAAQVVDARPLHLHLSGHEAGAAPAAASETPRHRHPRARHAHRARPARRAGSAHPEHHADHARETSSP